MRLVEVVPYREEWPRQFQQEAALIHQVLGPEIVTIHHIGSTSVPGLQAKPIIDMIPVVSSITNVNNHIQAMKEIGYESLGENGLTGRRYFRKGGDKRTHHIHVYEEGHPDIERHLVFRDYLRNHPEDLHAYGQLKEELAAQFPSNIDAYIEGKDSLVKEIEQKAIAWRKRSL